MARLTRQLHKLTKGGNEEWWRLVFGANSGAKSMPMDMVFLASPSAALLFAAGTRIEIRPV
jgi:hypothetical protein